MKQHLTLIISSLLTILLFMLHWADDVVRGFATPGPAGLLGVLMMVVWLWGALVWTGRRAGYVITLLGSLMAVGVLFLHMRGAGLVGGRIAGTSGQLLWVTTLLAMGVAGGFSAILSIRGLWRARPLQATTRPDPSAP